MLERGLHNFVIVIGNYPLQPMRIGSKNVMTFGLIFLSQTRTPTWGISYWAFSDMGI